jgi:hypothetical protein
LERIIKQLKLSFQLLNYRFKFFILVYPVFPWDADLPELAYILREVLLSIMRPVSVDIAKGEFNSIKDLFYCLLEFRP